MPCPSHGRWVGKWQVQWAVHIIFKLKPPYKKLTMWQLWVLVWVCVVWFFHCLKVVTGQSAFSVHL